MARPSPPDARERARRLATVDAAPPAAPPDPAPPWRPVLEGPAGGGPEDDVTAVAARFRSGALGAVSAGYAAAHGHPTGADVHPAAGPRRWAVTARAAALALAALLAVGAAVVTVAVSRGAGAPTARVVDLPAPRATAPSSGPASDGTSTAAGAPTPTPGLLLVHVVGAVERPGLVRLPAGARLEDAVEAAGGATSSAALDAVNLARPVADGEQVRVPRRGETDAATTAGPAGTGAGRAANGAVAPSAGPLDLNTADAAALDALPGIGPVLAQRIVERRTEKGPYTSIDQLDEVAGVGPTLLARLRPLVRV